MPGAPGFGMNEMAPAETKAHIRKERLAARDALSPEARAEKSARMAQQAGAVLTVPPGSVISGFLPIRSEADIRPLMEQLRVAGARVCVPVVIDKETIVFRELGDGSQLVPGAFGTFGPPADAVVLEPDLMLVPLSAFDRQGQRIGYGGGYYDRAIAILRRKGLARRLIGIAFDCQEVPSVPAEPHDVRLDAILTESGLRTFSPETDVE